MKTEELRELPLSEVRKHLEDTREEVFNLRFQGATGQLENYKRLGLMRREIARTLTVIRERELGIERDVVGEKPDVGGDEEKGRRGLRRRRSSKGTRAEKGEE